VASNERFIRAKLGTFAKTAANPQLIKKAGTSTALTPMSAVDLALACAAGTHAAALSH
jgi:hypothetical protein